jgi:hypothetical protein
MAGSVPGTDAHAETVRQYAKALIRRENKDAEKVVEVVEKKTEGGPLNNPQLGDDADAVAKAYRKTDEYKAKKGRKKKKKVETGPATIDPALSASFAGEPAHTDEQLAKLAEQAKQALEQAEKLAGEPVAYIAAMIVPARLVREDSPFRQVERYKIINEW